MLPDFRSAVDFAAASGGAIGDALGAPVEFLSRVQIRERYGENGVERFEVAYGRRGAVTDDTQMTMFTAEGLLQALRQGRGGIEESPGSSCIAPTCGGSGHSNSARISLNR